MDGYVINSTKEGDLDRERAERDGIPARAAAAKQAQADAQAAVVAKRQADELAEIETRVRSHFIGSESDWEKEKGKLLEAERHRLSHEAEARARRVAAVQYQ